MLRHTAHTLAKHDSTADTVDPTLSNFGGSRRMVHETRPHKNESSGC